MIRESLATGLTLLALSCGTSTQSLDNKYNELYCLRRTLVATNGEKTIFNSDCYGTAFIIKDALAPETDNTLLATAAHVVKVELPAPPEGFNIINIVYTLVDGESDSDATDDIPVKVKGIDSLDVALLEADKRLDATTTNFCTTYFVGDTAVIMGYYKGETKTISKGITSSNVATFTNMVGVMTDASIYFGMSGGPAYIINDNESCLAGVGIGFTDNGAFSIVSAPKRLEALVDFYRDTPELLEMQLQSKYPDIYKLQTTDMGDYINGKSNTNNTVAETVWEKNSVKTTEFRRF